MSTPDHAARATDEAEAQAAAAMEHVVGTRGFGGLLGQVAENTAAIGRLGTDAMDLVLRNLRLVGRRDIQRLSHQLARTEDKLERVLQEIEELQAVQAPEPVAAPKPVPARKPANGKPVAS